MTETTPVTNDDLTRALRLLLEVVTAVWPEPIVGTEAYEKLVTASAIVTNEERS